MTNLYPALRIIQLSSRSDGMNTGIAKALCMLCNEVKFPLFMHNLPTLSRLMAPRFQRSESEKAIEFT